MSELLFDRDEENNGQLDFEASSDVEDEVNDDNDLDTELQ